MEIATSIGLWLLSAYWLWMAWLALSKKATWRRFERRWVKSTKGSQAYRWDAAFFGFMGLMILSVDIWFWIGK